MSKNSNDYHLKQSEGDPGVENDVQLKGDVELDFNDEIQAPPSEEKKPTKTFELEPTSSKTVNRKP